MSVEIGDLVGYIHLDDELSSACELAAKRLEAVGEGVGKLDVALAALGVVAFEAGEKIMHMAEKGSVIQDISDQFQYLAARAGVDAEKAMEELRKGTHQTMTEFDLMKGTLSMLNMGFKGSAEEMGIIAQAAFQLSKRGVEIEHAFNLISRAVTTGRTRMLQYYGIQVDVSQATSSLKAAAKEHGTTVDQQTIALQKQGAVLTALTKFVKTGYQAHESFKDRVEAARTAVKDFTEELEKEVAKSPAVNSAFDRIKQAFADAFGSDKKMLIERFGKIIDWVAERVGDLGVKVIKAGAWIAEAARSILEWWDRLPSSVREFLGTMFDVTAYAVIAVSVFGTLVKVVGAVYGAFMGLAAPVGSLAGMAFSALKTSIDLVILGITWLEATVPALTAKVVIWEVASIAAGAAQKALAAAMAFTSETIAVFTGWLTATTAATWLSNTASAALAAVKGFLAAAIITVNTSLGVFGAQLATSTAMTWLQNTASVAAAAGVTMLGGAILLLTRVLLPLTVAWGAWKLGEWIADFPIVAQGVDWLLHKIGLITDAAYEARNAMRSMTAAAPTSDKYNPLAKDIEQVKFEADMLGIQAGKTGQDLQNFVNDAVERFKKLHDDGSAAIGELQMEYKKLMEEKAPEAAFRQLAEDAAALKTKVGELPPELEGLIMRFKKTEKGAGDLSQAMMKVQEAFKFASEHKAAVDTEWMARYINAEKPVQVANDALTSSQHKLATSYVEMGLSIQQTALLLGVNELAVKATIEADKELTKSILEQNAARQATLAKNIADTKAGAEAVARAKQEQLIGELTQLKDFQEKNRLVQLSGTELELAQIEIQRKAEIDKYTYEGVIDTMRLAEINKYYDHQKDIVNKTYDTIEERIRLSGVKTVAEQKKALDELKTMYAYMKAHPELYSVIDVKKIKQQIQEAQDALDPNTFGSRFQKVASMLGTVFNNINSTMGQVFQIVSSGFEVITKKGADAGEKITAAFTMAAGVIAQLFGGSNSKWAQAGIGAASGAAAGAGLGFMLGGGLGAGIGAAIGGIAGAIGGWLTAMKQVREANKAATEQIKQYQKELQKTYGSIANIKIIGDALGIDLAGAWGDQSQAGLKHFQELMDQFNEKMELLQSSLEKYGLTWYDLNDDFKRMNLQNNAASLLASYQTMVSAGADPTKVIKGMAGDFSALVISAVKSGQKIPAALQPIIAQLIKMGKLSDAAAKALMGIEETSMPALADIKDAAERYGLTLDQLGPKVRQLNITEEATQIAADFKTLMDAGADFKTIMTAVPEDYAKAKKTLDDLLKEGADKAAQGTSKWQEYQDALAAMDGATRGMGQQVQELVNQALQYGMELPSAMKPIIEQMIEAGLLTDQNGKKLEDLGKLTFAVDLEKDFDTLIKKLDELIDKLSKTAGFISGMPDVDVDVNYKPGTVYDGDGGWGDYTQPPVSNAWRGGRVTTSGVKYLAGGAEIIPFVPRGTDTVPAMLTPGEQVLTVGESREYRTTPRAVNVYVTEQNEIHALDGADVQRVMDKSGVRALRQSLRNNANHEGEKLMETIAARVAEILARTA